jgi:hypothetical protein
MAEQARKKPKRRKCEGCGEKYPALSLRCPRCFTPNPRVEKPPLEASERLFGIILVVVGVLIAIPVVILVRFTGRWFVGIRGYAALGTVAFIAVGTIFNGVLFLCGVHPKDFYSWWNNQSPLMRMLIIGGLVLAGVVLLMIFMLAAGSGGGEPIEDIQFAPGFDDQ